MQAILNISRFTFETSTGKYNHENLHKDPNYYACPLFNCKQEYSDPTSLRNHVRKIHGENVWDFIKANKKSKKANGYGLIGISEDGTPYDMSNDGAGSSNANREVNVGQTTYPHQGEHFVSPAYQHGQELQLFPPNVEHQQGNHNEEYLMQDNFNPNEDIKTDLSLWH
ncbi:unnamed protein product [Meloidogyne enterolobii]|uniref:Uncharacterized protein n=1 Tax=Meloidogyne enterolobii TaxID=390850 RepID=A0ACB0XWY1_MELEN